MTAPSVVATAGQARDTTSIPPIALTFLIGTGAAVCFVIAALGPIAPRRRAAIAIVGVVVDWLPLFAGWMTVDDASQLLLAVHFGFGLVGYGLLVYCVIGWVRGRERVALVRVAFIGIWGIAYLAGVLMSIDALSV